MAVHRLAKYRIDDPFTRVPNVAVNDDALDLKALGLLVLMLSKPDGWRFKERNLASEAGVGRAQVRTAIATLIEAGYVHRRHESDDGRPVLVTEVYDTPQPALLAEGPETEPSGSLAGFESSTVRKHEGPETEPGSNNGVLATTDRAATTEEPLFAATSLEVVDDAPDFEQWWERMPRRNGKRVGKGEAREVWRKLSTDKRRRAFEAAQHYRDSCDRGDTIAKDPVRFLRRDYFEDWLEPATPAATSRAQQQQSGYHDAFSRLAAREGRAVGDA